MKNLLDFFRSPAFFKNLGIALVALLVIFWLIFKGLAVYTHHGETVSVPEFRGIKMKSLDGFIQGKQLKYLIIDSIFDTKKDKGVVIKQEPEAGSLVKQDRTIYLYVTSVMPPRVPMPHLEDRSLRQAIAILETYGLKLAKPVKRKPDVCNGCVVNQEYKGRRISEGTQIERGSEITLTVGEGHNGEGAVGIPNLVGLTLREAIQRLNESNLSEGAAVFDKGKKEKMDTANARVYRQVPAPGSDNTLNPGSSIDLYLTTDKNKLQAPEN